MSAPLRQPSSRSTSLRTLAGVVVGLQLLLSACAPIAERSADGIFRVRTDGTELTQIASEPAIPVWSPDGGRLAWSNGRDIKGVSLAGGEPTILASGLRPNVPAWRPDGAAIAFVDDELAVLSVVHLSNNETSVIPLLEPSSSDEGSFLPLRNRPSWAPEGSELAVVSWDGNGDEVYVADVASTPIRIDRVSSVRASGEPVDRARPSGPTKPLADAARPEWSPDGERIAFALIPEVARSTGGIYTVRSNGMLQRRQSSVFPVSGPRWSPDGRTLLFIGRAAAGTDLYQLDLDRRRILNLTEYNVLVPRDADWSPSGDQIVFSAEGAIYRLDLATRMVDLVVDTPADDLSPDWSPDGAWIAFRAETDIFQQPSLPTFP